MNLPIISKTLGLVGNDALFQARLVAPDGTGQAVQWEGNAVKQGDCASIVCNVYDLTGSTPQTPITPGPTISVAAVISNTLLADNLWGNKDQIGRNFLHHAPGSFFATANHTYWFQYTLVTTGGTTMSWIHQHTATPIVPTN